MKDIPLSPIDYVFTGEGSQPITFAFSYDTQLDPDLLRTALVKTLEHFPTIPSTLIRSGPDTFAFRVSPDRSILEVLQSDESFLSNTDIHRYITPVASLEGRPLSAITLTQTPSGSVLAASCSHALVDGFSYFHFLSSWARISRGDRILRPILDREGMKVTEPDLEASVTADDILEHAGLFIGEGRRRSKQGPVREERFFMSKQEIQSYIEKAREEYPEISLTENHMITAFLWKKYIPMWSRDADNPVTYMTCPFDFRRVLRSVPRTYLGCALSFATAGMHLDELVKGSLGEVASQIKQAIKSLDQERIRSSLAVLDAYRRERGTEAITNILLRHPEHGMIVTNLTRMPIADLDFGSGSPVNLSTYNDVLRGAAILPAEDGVEIVVEYPENDG